MIDLFLLILSVFFHEVGHWLVMDLFDIYGGYEFNILTIEMKVKESQKGLEMKYVDFVMCYLVGLMLSFIVLPAWIYFGYDWKMLFAFNVGCAIADLYYLVRGTIKFLKMGLITAGDL